jgi:hypothetical protein
MPRWARVARVRARNLRRWSERSSSLWIERLAPWGSSVLAHVAAVFALALVLFAGPRRDEAPPLVVRLGEPLPEALTAMAPADSGGDPFTSPEPPPTETEAPPEPPSTEGEPVPEAPSNVELTKPGFSPDSGLGDGSGRPAGGVGPAGGTGPAGESGKSGGEPGPLATPGPSAPFSGRRGAARARLVRQGGGTARSEAAVELGLRWIARHQNPDGSWSLDISGRCGAPACPRSIAMDKDPTAGTGFALLPLLGAGHTHVAKGPYKQAIEAGLGWLIKVQKPDGDLYVGSGRHMYSHAIATMALCEAYGLTGDKALLDPARRAVAFIVAAQQPKGGWRYEPQEDGDTSVFGWQMLAIRSAHLAGLKAPAPAVEAALKYLERAKADDDGLTYAYQPGHGASPVMTAEALLIRQYTGWGRDHPKMIKAARMVASQLFQSRERNLYYWYYATQLLHNMGNDDWKRWNAIVRDGLVATQSKGPGCDRGSWDPTRPERDRWSTAGRLYTTSLSLLTLEVYYRYLPLYRRGDESPMGGGR